MAATAAQNNIWRSMNYVPPRGACQHKSGMIASKCPCLRFMIHPLKVATSFECDGCNHHASFHNMENKEDDEIVQRWRLQEVHEATQMEPSKRKRPRNQIEYPTAPGVLDDKMDLANGSRLPETTRRTRGKGAKKATPVPESSSSSKVFEILDED